MIDPKNWVWYGRAAHFIASESCRFHLATQVGAVMVSTVGAYYPFDGHRELDSLRRQHNALGIRQSVALGIEREDGMRQIGLNRFYETMRSQRRARTVRLASRQHVRCRTTSATPTWTKRKSRSIRTTEPGVPGSSRRTPHLNGVTQGERPCWSTLPEDLHTRGPLNVRGCARAVLEDTAV